MLKYYALAFLVVIIALFYAFLADPCNKRLRMDFASKYPSYEILETGASEGSPESVRCHVSYRKPDSERVYEAIWLYRHSREGWRFSRVLESPRDRRERADASAHQM